ncbi:MAG: hypothetical protein ACLSAJ_11670 [Intestinibacter bartlettii]|nr:hypothetical protein [Intestinibacter bartlettii]
MMLIIDWILIHKLKIIKQQHKVIYIMAMVKEFKRAKEIIL